MKPVGWVTRIIALAGPPVMAWTAIMDPWWETAILAVIWMFTGQMGLETAYNKGTVHGLRR